MTINRSLIMKKGHEIAKELTGDYHARLSVGLKQAWALAKKELKGENTKMVTLPVLEGTEKQIAWATEIRDAFYKAYTILKPYIELAFDHSKQKEKITLGNKNDFLNLIQDAFNFNDKAVVTDLTSNFEGYYLQKSAGVIINVGKSRYKELKIDKLETQCKNFDEFVYLADNAMHLLLRYVANLNCRIRGNEEKSEFISNFIDEFKKVYPGCIYNNIYLLKEEVYANGSKELPVFSLSVECVEEIAEDLKLGLEIEFKNDTLIIKKRG